ncbi:MAG: ABC transporter substrate-binding protein [Anaerolineae bacterium]
MPCQRLFRFLILIFVLFGSACRPQPLFPVVKIGLVAPFEGRYRAIGYDAIYAARLAVREINAGGGVDGRRLALVAYDDRNDPQLARTLARNLTIDPQVVAVLGHYRQTTTRAAQAIYAAHGVPLLALSAWPTSTHLIGGQLLPSPEALAQAMVAEAPLAETGCGTIWGDDVLAQALSETLGERRCVTPEAEPAFALSAAPAHVTAQRVRDWEGPLIGGPELSAPDFVHIAGSISVEGTLFITPYPFPRDLPGTGAWTAAYTSMGPHVSEPGAYALPTYEAVYLLAEAFAEALKTHGRLTPTGVQQTLRAVSRTGALGTIHLDKEGIWSTAPLYLYTWREGEPHLLARQATGDRGDEGDIVPW